MKKIILSLLSLCLPLVGYAQSSSDTLTITQCKTLPAYHYSMPFMSDSVDIRGDQFDVNALYGPVPFVEMDDPRLASSVADADGFYTFGGRSSIYTFVSSLLTTKYENVTVQVESSTPYRIYLEGGEIGSKKEEPSEGLFSDTYTLKLEPSAHRLLMVRCMIGDKEAIQKLRVRLVPEGVKTTLDIRDDAKEYMSMDFTLSGEAFTGVSMSPSGKYTIVRKRNYVDLKSTASTLLYEGEQLRTELSGALASADWMPKSDLLWITRDTDKGRELVVYDPSTLHEAVIAASIPEGPFEILRDEQTLIYTKTQEGPRIHKYIDRVMGRYDHHKNNPDRDRTSLYAYDIKSGIFKPLTFGYRSTSLIDSSIDSKEIIISSGHKTTTSPFSTTDFMTMNLETGRVDTLFANTANLNMIYYTSDPKYLLISGNADAFEGIGRNLPEGVLANTYDTQLFLYNRETKNVKALTKDFDPNVLRVIVSVWNFNALFSAEDKDYKQLFILNLASGHITKVPTHEEYVGGFSADQSLRHYAYEGESANNSDRLYMGNLSHHTEKVIDDLAAERLKNVELGKVSDWTFTMPNGDKVPGRFYLPPNFDAAKKYPMLVYYYGGTSPSSRIFDWYYSHPMYAGQGYIVLTLNPSGTTGWGQEYASRHVNAWGKRTADEIVAAVKGFCAQHSYVKADKVGCFGASYGGFMTQYLQTITDIFAAAISHAGISALSSYWGQGTWGIGYSTVASRDSYPWNNPKLYVEQSPLFHADKINTPLLLLHGTADTNVPFGESVQMYNALKILGKEVELVRVYGEDHHIMDLPKRVEWMHTMMAWFQKWLKDDPTWWNEMFPETNL